MSGGAEVPLGCGDMAIGACSDHWTLLPQSTNFARIGRTARVYLRDDGDNDATEPNQTIGGFTEGARRLAL